MSGLFPGEGPEGVSDIVLHDKPFEVHRVTTLEAGGNRAAGEVTVGITFIGDMRLTFSYKPEVAKDLGRVLIELAEMIEAEN